LKGQQNLIFHKNLGIEYIFNPLNLKYKGRLVLIFEDTVKIIKTKNVFLN